jgi:hypothetical protein
MLWRRKKLDEDMCVTAVVALHLYMKRLESGSSLDIAPGDVVQFALDRYGIEIPEDLARETLERLTEMGIMVRTGNGYTLADVAAQAFALAHTATRGMDPRSAKATEVAERALSIATTLLASYGPSKVIATMRKLKEVSECGMNAIKKLAESA